MREPTPKQCRTMERDALLASAINDGLYVVTEDGRIFSGRTGREIRQNDAPYLKVHVHINGMIFSVRVHRVVAIAYHGLPSGYREVNHLNGVKSDNRSANLEWVTPKQNSRHAIETGLQPAMKGEKNGNALLSESQVGEIRTLWAEGTCPAREIAARFNISENTVKSIVKGQAWRHTYTGICERGRRGSQGGEFHPNHKLTAANVLEIKRSIKAGEKLSAIAAKYGVRLATISGIKRGVSWRHIS